MKANVLENPHHMNTILDLTNTKLWQTSLKVSPTLGTKLEQSGCRDSSFEIIFFVVTTCKESICAMPICEHFCHVQVFPRDQKYTQTISLGHLYLRFSKASLVQMVSLKTREKIIFIGFQKSFPIRPESDFYFFAFRHKKMNATINSTISKEEEETSSQSEVEDGINTKLYVLASIIVLTLLGNVLIMILVTCRRDNPMTRVQFFMLHLSIGKV